MWWPANPTPTSDARRSWADRHSRGTPIREPPPLPTRPPSLPLALCSWADEGEGEGEGAVQGEGADEGEGEGHEDGNEGADEGEGEGHEDGNEGAEEGESRCQDDREDARDGADDSQWALDRSVCARLAERLLAHLRVVRLAGLRLERPLPCLGRPANRHPQCDCA